MSRLVLSLTFAVTVLIAASAVAAAVAVAQSEPVVQTQPGYQFQLGFAALADLIPGVVGEPVENEHPGSEGTMIQRTTTGLMVWREADNWTGFTDGARTWILGPFGLAERSNDERFVWESDPPLTFDNPIAYCAYVGTVDQMGPSYTGPAYPPAVKDEFARIFGPAAVELPPAGIFLRCYDGELLACTVGANLNCGKADTSREPNPEMVSYCQANPDSSFIPAYITGHEGIYAWGCSGGAPVIQSQVFQVDPRGFVAENWYEIPPPQVKQ